MPAPRFPGITRRAGLPAMLFIRAAYTQNAGPPRQYTYHDTLRYRTRCRLRMPTGRITCSNAIFIHAFTPRNAEAAGSFTMMLEIPRSRAASRRRRSRAFPARFGRLAHARSKPCHHRQAAAEAAAAASATPPARRGVAGHARVRRYSAIYDRRIRQSHDEGRLATCRRDLAKITPRQRVDCCCRRCFTASRRYAAAAMSTAPYIWPRGSRALGLLNSGFMRTEFPMRQEIGRATAIDSVAPSRCGARRRRRHALAAAAPVGHAVRRRR